MRRVVAKFSINRNFRRNFRLRVEQQFEYKKISIYYFFYLNFVGFFFFVRKLHFYQIIIRRWMWKEIYSDQILLQSRDRIQLKILVFVFVHTSSSAIFSFSWEFLLGNLQKLNILFFFLRALPHRFMCVSAFQVYGNYFLWPVIVLFFSFF